MKQLIFALILTASVSPALASDSTWTVCSSKSFLVSAYEHRTGASKRQTEVTLIYGGHEAKGILSEHSSAVDLSSATMNINAQVSLNEEAKRMTIEGALFIQGQRFDIEETLKCIDKTQLASPGNSGH